MVSGERYAHSPFLSMADHLKPEDHWSYIAHLRAEDILKSVVIELDQCVDVMYAFIFCIQWF